MNNGFHLTGTAAAVAMILSSSIILGGCGDKPEAPEKAVISVSTVGSFASFSTNACISEKGCIYAWKIDGESSGSERNITQVIKKAGSHTVSVQATRDGKTLADLSANFVIDAAPEKADKALWNSPAGHIAKSDASGESSGTAPADESKSDTPAAPETYASGEKGSAGTAAKAPAPEAKTEKQAPAPETSAPAAEEKPAAPAETPAPEQKDEKQESSGSSSGDGSSFTVDFGDMFGSDTVSAGESVKEGSADAKTEEPKAEEQKEATAEEPKAEEQKAEEQKADTVAAAASDASGSAAGETAPAENSQKEDSASADEGKNSEPQKDSDGQKADGTAAPAADPMGRRQMAQPLLPQMRQLRRAQQALLLGMPGAMLPRLPPPRMPRLAVIQRRMMEVNRMPPHMQRISQASSLRMRPQSQRRRMTQPKRTRSLQTLQSRLMTG